MGCRLGAPDFERSLFSLWFTSREILARPPVPAAEPWASLGVPQAVSLLAAATGTLPEALHPGQCLEDGHTAAYL
jgi:hypothetical protein